MFITVEPTQANIDAVSCADGFRFRFGKSPFGLQALIKSERGITQWQTVEMIRNPNGDPKWIGVYIDGKGEYRFESSRLIGIRIEV